MTSPRLVKAWDWPTRAFHWALVFCVFSAWASIKFADALGDINVTWHRWNGYTVLVLIVFRIIWGFVGSSTARFVAFITWPWNALRYAIDSARGRSKAYLGHNPVGTWMIIVLLSAVILQASMGLFSVTETAAGPLKRLIDHDLSEQITKLHAKGIYVIFALVAVHVTANSLYGAIKKEPLIRAMVTGKKPTKDYADQQEAVIVVHVTAKAALCLVGSIAVVFGGITLAGGRIF